MGWAAGAASRHAVLVSMVLALPVGSAIAGFEQNAEDRFDEARTKPATVAQHGNWVIVPIKSRNAALGPYLTYDSRDNATMSLTAEWRHKFPQRWGMIAFAETGRVAPSVDKLSQGRAINSYGGGVRWQVTADRELNLGLDSAVSTDDSAVFIQIGEKF